MRKNKESRSGQKPLMYFGKLKCCFNKTLDSLDIQMHAQPNKLSSSLKDGVEHMRSICERTWLQGHWKGTADTCFSRETFRTWNNQGNCFSTSNTPFLAICLWNNSFIRGSNINKQREAQNQRPEPCFFHNKRPSLWACRGHGLHHPNQREQLGKAQNKESGEKK